MSPLLLLFAPMAAPTETFTVEGVSRTAVVHAGTGRAPAAGRPLVLVFHGHGGTAKSSDERFHVQTLWPEATVVYPQGLPTATNRDARGERPGWQNAPGANGDRDLKLVDALLASTKGYDPRRVYAMGFSNGGAFVFLLWAERSERFAAYGAGGASGARSLRRLKPAPALLTMGESDSVASPERQKATIEALARLNGVDLSSARRDGRAAYAKGKLGLELGTYIHPGGHEYPPEAVKATIEFFKRQAPRSR